MESQRIVTELKKAEVELQTLAMEDKNVNPDYQIFPVHEVQKPPSAPLNVSASPFYSKNVYVYTRESSE